MSEEETPGSPFDDESRLTPRGYHVGIGFTPAVSLVRKEGLRLVTRLEDYLDVQHINLEPHQWQIGQPERESGTAGERFLVTVRPNRLNIEHFFPGRALEQFEERMRSVLEVFGEIMHPQVIVQSGAMARFTFQLDEDARVFLAQRKLHLDQPALAPFGRPAHVIGLRLFFPLVAAKQPEARRDWQVNVRIESLAEDPRRLFIEADAQWKQPMPWRPELLPKIVERVDTAHTFVRKNVLEFLRQDSTRAV